jgi:hypothetical protein
VERTVPGELQLDMRNEDVHGLEFLVFRRPARLELTGTVDTDDHQLLKYLKVPPPAPPPRLVAAE